jgi:hypothetical protein
MSDHMGSSEAATRRPSTAPLRRKGPHGSMLPCKVMVEDVPEGVLVSFANPSSLLTVGDVARSSELLGVAAEARERMLAVVQALAAGGSYTLMVNRIPCSSACG